MKKVGLSLLGLIVGITLVSLLVTRKSDDERNQPKPQFDQLFLNRSVVASRQTNYAP